MRTTLQSLLVGSLLLSACGGGAPAAPNVLFIVTDTLPMPADADPDLIEVLSVAPLIARAIDAVFGDASVSEIFGGDNLS